MEKDYKKLIPIARDSIKGVLKKKDPEISDEIKSEFSEKQGAFVTLKKYGHLRGCIGYIEPIMPLWKTISNAAVAAAFKDIRFPPLKESELNEIRIELSILTVPKLIEVNDPNEYFQKIKLGRDGLIIKHPMGEGVLLPQVPEEWGWTLDEYLMNLCHKAGLPSYAWRDKETKIYSFQAIIVEE